MALKPLDQIDSDVEDEVLARHEKITGDLAEGEYVLVFDANDQVVCEMAQGILDENDVAYIKKADDTLGIFGVAMHAKLYVKKEDCEFASSLLLECGFLDESEDTDSGAEFGGPGDGPPDGGDEKK